MSGPVGVDKFTFLAEQFVRMSAKIVPLSLQQVCRQSGGPEPVVEGQSRRQGGSWYTDCYSCAYYYSGASMTLAQSLSKEVVQQ